MGQMKLIGSIVVLVIMVLSAVAFALSSAQYNQNNQQAVVVPSVINYELSPQEQIQVLTSGKVIIENFYDQNCTDCIDRNAMLNGFAVQMKDFVVLENVAGNQTRLGLIGNGGKIVPLESNITQETLLKTFCENAILQPKECIMMEY